MHNDIAFLKRAVDRANASIMGCYAFEKDKIRAMNGKLFAGIDMSDFPLNHTFNVPADSFDEALSMVGVEPNVDYKDGVVTIRKGKFKYAVKCPDQAPFPDVELDQEWKPLPESFIPALKIATPFLKINKEVRFGVRLDGDKMTVCEGRSVIQFTLTGMDMVPTGLSTACADFLLAQETPPSEYSQNKDRWIAFRWPNQRWMRAGIEARDFPGNIDSIFDNGGDPTFEITEDWRATYRAIAAMHPDVIKISSTNIRAVKEPAAGDAEIETPIDAKKGFTQWASRLLNPVVEIATHWNPNAYPSNASFKGSNFRGIVAAHQAS